MLLWLSLVDPLGAWRYVCPPNADVAARNAEATRGTLPSTGGAESGAELLLSVRKRWPHSAQNLLRLVVREAPQLVHT